MTISPPAVTSTTVNCTFYNYPWPDNSQNIYYCHVTNHQILDNPRLKITEATGKHDCNKTDTSVEGVRINFAANLQQIPKGLDKVFLNIILLGFYANKNFKKLQRDDLRPFPKLKFLYFDQNAIEVIEADLFRYNPNLEIIKLFKNKIASIVPMVFSDLKSLRVLDISDNMCEAKFSKASNRVEVEKIVKDIEGGQCHAVKIDFFVKLQLLQASHEKLKQRQERLEDGLKIHQKFQVESLENLADETKIEIIEKIEGNERAMTTATMLRAAAATACIFLVATVVVVKLVKVRKNAGISNGVNHKLGA
jgi:hypothetical protein